MRRRMTTSALALVMACTGAFAGASTATAAPAASAPAAGAASAYAGLTGTGVVQAQLQRKKKKSAKRGVAPGNPYTPRTGPIINNPFNKSRQHVITNHMLRTIQSVPAGGRIRMSDWNIDSQRFVDTAVAAHRRGASVQILMSKGVADRQNPSTGTFAKLRRNLAKGNAGRPTGQGSFIKGCNRSCRGGFGVNHAKFLYASQTGIGARVTAKNVVMVSSANITNAAGLNQWNDIFTVSGSTQVASFTLNLFAQMRPDRPVANPYKVQTNNGIPWLNQVWANPHRRGDTNPSVQMLARVNGGMCRNPGANAGLGGRTAIRIAHTAITGPHGAQMARQLVRLRKEGCNIKVVFALMDEDLRTMFSRNKVPNRQLVRDTDRDGFYDRYLHTKIMTINGNYAGNPNTHLVRTGSENMTYKSFLSDEIGFTIDQPGYMGVYQRWMDYAFSIANKNFTRKPPPDARTLDPFRYVQL